MSDFDEKRVSEKVMIWKLFLRNKKNGFQNTTFVTNILKLLTNPKVLIQAFVWSFEVLITNV